MKINKVFETPNNGHYFFGYYDKSPLNKNNTKLLACKTSFIDRMPTKNDVLEIGYFEWQKSNKFVKITETRAWNWQQGCMLQWLSPKYDKKIIYNDRIDNKFVTVILDIESGKKDILPMAYYTMGSDGEFVLCIDNERHYWFRDGYNYQGIKNLTKKKPIDENGGIWYINIKTKETKQIITQKELLNIKPLSNMRDTIHYVEHLMISPDNKRFCFLHRWQIEDGGIYTRFYTANVDGSDIYLLNDSGRMSHFCWRNEKELIGWGGVSNPINSIRKYKNIAKFFIKPLMPLYKKIVKANSVDGNTKLSSLINGDSYILFKDKSNKKQKFPIEVLNKDGHPSFSKVDQNLMLTDTYPNIYDNYNQELILYDFKKQEKFLVDKLKHIPEFFGKTHRCDLHPKWSLDGRYICVDTVDKGYRNMYIYEIK